MRNASPEGACATAYTATPKSLAPFRSTGSAAPEAGTQIAPAPRSTPAACAGPFSQYTSALAFSRRFTSVKE